jgi:hypothetical protein
MFIKCLNNRRTNGIFRIKLLGSCCGTRFKKWNFQLLTLNYFLKTEKNRNCLNYLKMTTKIDLNIIIGISQLLNSNALSLFEAIQIILIVDK